MPGTPGPVGKNGPFSPHWNAVLGAIRGSQDGVRALQVGAQNTNILDQYGNTIQVSGSNLNQIVTIGSSFQQAGVQVSTGIPSGAGLATQSGPSITSITLTKGSSSATVGAVSGAALAVGQVIGAQERLDPALGVQEPSLTPGTTIATVSGSSITLSQGAAEGGTNLYCAAARFIVQQDTGWEALSLATNINNGGGYPAAARQAGTIISLCGQLVNNTGSTTASGAVWATLPSGIRPTAAITTPVWNIATNGQMSYQIPVANGNALPLDSIVFRAS